MRGVNLDRVQTDPGCAPCRIGEGIADTRKAIAIEREWWMLVGFERQGARGKGLPTMFGIGCDLRPTVPALPYSPCVRHGPSGSSAACWTNGARHRRRAASPFRWHHPTIRHRHR